MAFMQDAASFGGMNRHENEMLLKAKVRLNSDAKITLLELDEYEAISLVFLVLDIDHLAREGFKYCQFICNNRAKDALTQTVNAVRHIDGHLDSVLEALYIIGRYDILEDHLGLVVDHNIHRIFKNMGSVPDDRKSLYCVFAGMAQEEADSLIQERLPGWFCPDVGHPVEETYIRNLNSGNYQQLLTELFEALIEENRESLAAYLQPYATRTSRSSSLVTQQSTFSEREDDLYPLPTSYPHGLCIIINVKTFMKPRDVNDDIPLSERHGSDIDRERLAGTFKLFGFHIMHFDNPDYEKICQFFKKLRQEPRLAVVSCLVVCIMTHGDEDDHIYLHDRTCLSITDIRKLCCSQVLLNKPRLFFVQACRGEQHLRPIFLTQDNCHVTNRESDCLISAATVKGHTAVRSQTEGSWYITDLCQALQEYGHLVPIKNVLQKTRKSLKDRVASMNNIYVTQLSEDKDTLLKDVMLVRAELEYFVDGILDLVQLALLENLISENLQEALDDMSANQLACVINRFPHMSI